MDTVTYALLYKKIKDVEAGTANIPTKISDLSEDSNHRTVSDVEKETWGNKSDFSGNYDDLVNKPLSLPASDVHEWAKAENKPTYTADEIGADAKGSASTAETNAKKYADEKFTELIGTPPENLDTIEEIADAIRNNQDAVDAIESAITNKVDKIDGKGLSTNDLSDELKADYNSAVEHANSEHAPVNAQENVIESISIDGVKQTIVDKNIELPLYSSAIVQKASGKTLLMTDSSDNNLKDFKIYGHTTQQTTTGAQLFDASRISSVSVGGATITNNKDGSFTVYGNGVLTESIISKYRLSHDEMVKLFHPGMIKVKVEDITAPYFVVRFYDSNNSQIKNLTTEVNRNSSVDITDILDEEGTYVEMQFYLSAGKEIKSATIKPMLYQDGNGIYEPYSGGISSPSPDYPQEFVSAGDKGIVETNIFGRNLFDVENAMKSQIEAGVAYINGRGELVLNGSYGSNNRAFFVTLSPGEYYLSGDEEVILHILAPQDFVWNRIINVEKETTYQCYIASGTYNNRVLHPAINLGAAPIPWEPYKQPQALTMLTPNGLPGIPVSSGGNYTDENGQQWISDYRDWGRGVDVHYIHVVDSWDSLQFNTHSLSTDTRLVVYIIDTEHIPMETGLGLSTHFKNAKHSSSLKTEDCIWIFGTNNGLHISISKSIASNAVELKNWLIDNKVIVQYPIKVPIETPIPAEELAACHVLHTNTPTTTIVNDEDCWMEVGYATDTANYIAKEHKKMSDNFSQSISDIDKNKVDKIFGKSLSTNDYTDSEKNKLASLNNYDDTSLSNRITSIENDYANKNYVAEQISNIGHLSKEIVTELPDLSVAKENVIYMIKDGSVAGDDKYNEYMLINNEIVKIGDTSIDLTDYSKISDVDKKLSNKVDRNVLLSILNNTPTVETLDEFLELQRNDKVYQVKIPKFTSNPTTTCEKLGANAGLVFEPSTDTVEGQDDYAEKIEFMWWHNNYIRNDDGYPIITALETDDDFSETGSVDVGSCGMSFYYKWDSSNDDYIMLSWSTSPHPELGLVPFSGNVPGHSYWCLSAYPSIIASDGLLRSQPNGKIARIQSHNNMITNYQKKGTGYWGAGAERNTFQIIFNTLMGATKSSQTLYAGVTNWNIQYDAAVERDTEETYFPVTASQAKNIEVGCYVSVGYGSIKDDALYKDRSVTTLHSYADDVKVLRIEDMDDGNKAVYLDIDTGFTTIPISLSDELSAPITMSSMHMWTGETNKVIGKHNGSAVSNTSGRHPYRVQGVEYALGAYIIASDTVMDFQSDYSKNVYVARKGVPHSSSDATIRSTYTLVGNIPASADGNGSDYWIGDINIDTETGVWYPSSEGSSNVQGVGDRIYSGGVNTSGTREYLQGGNLRFGSHAGSACLNVGHGLGRALWDFCGCD